MSLACMCGSDYVFAPVPAAPAISAVLQLAEIAVNSSILLFHLLTLTASDFFFPLPFFTSACLSQSVDSVFSRSASNHEPHNATTPPYPAPPPPYLFVSFCMDDKAGRCRAM